MKASGRSEGEWRRVELQLDTAQILLVIAMLLGLCAASFYLGRWIERDRWQEVSGRTQPPKNVKISDADAAADLTFFDKLGGQTSEPGRQARSSKAAENSGGAKSATPDSDTAEGPAEAGSRPAGAAQAGSVRTPSDSTARPSSGPAGALPSSSTTPSSASGNTSTSSGWAVQVFAGDRSQAEKVAASLAHKGYSTRLVPGSSGPRSARVRVVGYRSRTDAQQGAERLRRESNLKPWVVKPE